MQLLYSLEYKSQLQYIIFLLPLSRVCLMLQISWVFRRISRMDSHAHMGGVTYSVEMCVLCAYVQSLHVSKMARQMSCLSSRQLNQPQRMVNRSAGRECGVNQKLDSILHLDCDLYSSKHGNTVCFKDATNTQVRPPANTAQCHVLVDLYAHHPLWQQIII